MQIVALADLHRHLGDLPEVPRVVAPGSMATPLPLLTALAEALPAMRLFVVNAPPGIPTGPRIQHETVFIGPGMRREPGLRVFPMRLSLVPQLFRSEAPPDIVALHCSRVIGEETSMGIEVQVMRGALEAARDRGALVVAMINKEMPFTHGDAVVPLDEIDIAVEVDAPLPTAGPARVDEASRAIARQVVARIPDGATLQVGIGAVPDAVLHGLTDRRRLRVWTELLSQGYLELEQAGSLDPDHPLECTFIVGPTELYRFVDDNPRVQVLRCETTNHPARIASHPNTVSVNAALQVDLFGQVNASWIGTRLYSGPGGQPDFVAGAQMSEGGQAFIALRSWHDKGAVSAIVPQLASPATSLQPTAVVTEQGTAEVAGRDLATAAANLIERAAHPEARDQLREEARRLGL